MGLILILTIVIFVELRYYLGGLFAAIAMYTIVKMQMIRLVEYRKLNRGLSASIIVVASAIFIIIPLTGIGFLAADTISGISIDTAKITTTINDYANTLESKVGITILTPKILSFIPQLGTSIMQALVSGLSSMVINGLIAVFVLYFMLISYDSMERVILEILPFRDENKIILQQETRSIILSNAIGIPVVALTQGILAYFVFLSLGVNSPLVYAVLVSFTTVIPVVGTSLVWIPLGLNALLQGDILRGALIIIFGLVIIGGSDAVLRFVLQKKLANIHPLITFFGVLIGLAMFGFWGIIFGPLLLSLLHLLFNMYRHDYIKGSTAQPLISTNRVGQSNLFLKKHKNNS